MPALIYDGDCGFCRSVVRFIERRAEPGRVHLVPFGTPEAAALTRDLALPETVRCGCDTVVLVVGTTALLRSDAVLAAAALLRRPWSLLRLGLVVPRPLRDGAYRFVAKNRSRSGQ